MKGESRFDGLGVLGSVAFEFKVCQGLSVFGNVLGSMNYGYIKTHQDHTFFVEGEPLTGYYPIDPVHRVKVNAEIQGGISWKRTFANERTLLSLMVAYEQIAWFNMNTFKRYFSEEGGAQTLQFAIVDLTGDLTLRGLTFRASLGF